MSNYSHYSAKKKLSELMAGAIRADLSDEEAQLLACGEVKLFLSKVESPFFDDLYQVGLQFREWLQDWDIREKDSSYNRVRTQKLQNWLEENNGK
jgi:hypothetical protein